MTGSILLMPVLIPHSMSIDDAVADVAVASAYVDCNDDVSAKDELSLAELNAIAQRALRRPANEEDQRSTAEYANWLVFSAGLRFRSKTEFHRHKVM